MFKKFKNFSNKKDAGSKGAISVIVSLTVLAIILTIAMSASYTTTGELSLSGYAGESARAYYAAETGLEKAMYERFRGGGGLGMQPTGTICNLAGTSWEPGNIKYCLDITQSDPSDFNTISIIRSIGEYGSVRRSVQITF